MSHIVEEMPPTKRPEDPFVRQMGDNIAAIERNYQREGSGRGSRFEGQLLEDAQAEWVVQQTRRADRARYGIRSALTDWRIESVARLDALGPHNWIVRAEGSPVVVASFTATPSEAAKMLALLNRETP